MLLGIITNYLSQKVFRMNIPPAFAPCHMTWTGPKQDPGSDPAAGCQGTVPIGQFGQRGAPSAWAPQASGCQGSPGFNRAVVL